MTRNLVAYSNTCIVCESGIWACLSWILLQSLSQDCHQGVSQGWSLLREVRKDLLRRSYGCWQHSIPRRLLDWGLGSKSLCQPEVALTSLLHGYVGLSVRPLTWSMPSRESTESAAEMEAMISCNTFTVVTLPHLCHILLLRSQSQALPPLEGRGLHEAVDKRGRVVGISGSVSHRKACQMLHAFLCISTNSTNLS